VLNIGEKLKRARTDANMTQEALAEMLAVSRQTISNWENGRSYPDIASIIVLSDIYDITLDSLLKGDDEIIKHLKESTDTVKSNKRVVAGLIIFGFILLFLCVLGIIFRLVPRGLLVGMILLIVCFITVYLYRRFPVGMTKEKQAEQGGEHQ
jgi:transcriptional regulator with XRE-family HTH domain